MPNPQKIVVPFNKGKLVKFLIISLVFVVAAIWMLLSNNSSGNGLLSNPTVRRIAAITGILFFGGGAVVVIVKLTAKKPALIINDDGFIENASMFNWGTVSWADITGFRKLQVGRTSFIMVVLVNPNSFINRQKGVKRKLVAINNNQYGSPVSIAANNLNITIDELLLILQQWHQQYRQTNQPVTPPVRQPYSLQGLNKVWELLRAVDDVSLGYKEINFFHDALDEMQGGYSTDNNGVVITGKNNGDWRYEWLAIASDEVGDPILVNYEDANIPVFTAMHGEGRWDVTQVADTWQNFVDIITVLQQLSIDRQSPDQIERNRLPAKEVSTFLADTRQNNPGSEIWYWQQFLDEAK